MQSVIIFPSAGAAGCAWTGTQRTRARVRARLKRTRRFECGWFFMCYCFLVFVVGGPAVSVVVKQVSLRCARTPKFMMRRSGRRRHGLLTYRDWQAAPVGEGGFSLSQISAWIVGGSPPMPLDLHETAFSPPERPDGRFPEGMPRRSSQRSCKIRSPNQASPGNRRERTFRPAAQANGNVTWWPIHRPSILDDCNDDTGPFRKLGSRETHP